MTLATYTSVLLWPAANPVHSRTWILLAPVGASRVDGLDLTQLGALVHGEQLASFRRLVEATPSTVVVVHDKAAGCRFLERDQLG
jgi:hypothetical protein